VTESEAMEVVNRMTFAVQRMRTMAIEQLGDDTTTLRVLTELEPWVHGPKCILPALTKVQDRGSVTPGELLNFCYIAHHFSTISMAVGIMASAGDWGISDPIPEPDINWAVGWSS
jgi:hypothetical protein